MLLQRDVELNFSLVESDEELLRAIDVLDAHTGPVAVDAERASGFRYSQRAYLIQLARGGSETFLIDPLTITEWGPFQAFMNAQTWILHAATQDLPCLRELGLEPSSLLDTELAGRLLGMPRVSLGVLVEEFLAIKLEKAHSADDWSTRPLPEAWLEYAALDAAVLPGLWEKVAQALQGAKRYDIALQEFDYVLRKPEKPAPKEPWRKLSGVHKLRGSKALAIARELWQARDALARERDIAPGRLIPDKSIVFAAQYNPRSAGDLARQKDFHGRASRTELTRWWNAIRRGKVAENPPYPERRAPGTLPHPRTWERQNPEAAERFQAVRPALNAHAEAIGMPAEQLLGPDVVRSICWEPPEQLNEEHVTARLTELGARTWQIEETRQIFMQSFSEIP